MCQVERWLRVGKHGQAQWRFSAEHGIAELERGQDSCPFVICFFLAISVNECEERPYGVGFPHARQCACQGQLGSQFQHTLLNGGLHWLWVLKLAIQSMG